MKPPPRRERSSMNMGTSTNFAEQEAAAMDNCILLSIRKNWAAAQGVKL